MAPNTQVHVQGYAGRNFTIDVCDTQEDLKKTTVLQLKQKIVQKVPIIKDDEYRLTFSSIPLEDSVPLSSYKIKHMSSILLTRILPGGGDCPQPETSFHTVTINRNQST